MALSIQQFISTYAGKSIFIPGYSTAECVAAFWAFNAQVNKAEKYSANGAYNLWTQRGYPYNWDTYSRSANPVWGSWAIWSGVTGPYTNAGNGHVAMFLKDNGNGTGQFMSQNPGPFRETTLSLTGIVGYLVAKGVATGVPTATAGTGATRKVTQNVAWVRTGPGTNYPLAPAYAKGLAKGATLAVKGYVAGQDPFSTGDNAWYVTKSGFYVWANAAENTVKGLKKL